MNKISPCGTYCKVAKGDDVLHGFKTWTQEILRKTNMANATATIHDQRLKGLHAVGLGLCSPAKKRKKVGEKFGHII